VATSPTESRGRTTTDHSFLVRLTKSASYEEYIRYRAVRRGIKVNKQIRPNKPPAGLVLLPLGFSCFAQTNQLSSLLLQTIEDVDLLRTSSNIAYVNDSDDDCRVSTSVSSTEKPPLIASLADSASRVSFDLSSILLSRQKLTVLDEMTALALSAYTEHLLRRFNAPVPAMASCPQRTSCLALGGKADLSYDLEAVMISNLYGREILLWFIAVMSATRIRGSPAGMLAERVLRIVTDYTSPMSTSSTSGDSPLDGNDVVQVSRDLFFWDEGLTRMFGVDGIGYEVGEGNAKAPSHVCSDRKF
jgi:hypothetical protein